MWPFNREEGFWDEVRYRENDPDVWPGELGGVLMKIRRCLPDGAGGHHGLGDWQLDVHQIWTADPPERFHTHRYEAWRVVLRGGYEEEVHDGPRPRIIRRCGPGYVSRVYPEYCHRIHRLLDGPSTSLWLRGPPVAPLRFRGTGWRDPA